MRGAGAVVTSQARTGGVCRAGVSDSCTRILSESTCGSSLLAMLESCGPALVLSLVVLFIGAPVDIGPWPVVLEEVFTYLVSWQTAWVPRLPSMPSKSRSDHVLE